MGDAHTHHPLRYPRSPSSSTPETMSYSGELKALILVGGFGTRLRPLTLTLPKPLVDFCNKPMIMHQIEALVKAGVKHIVLAVNYRPEIMVSLLSKLEEKYGISITFSVEQEPLGTAGPLALAKNVLGKDDAPFFVLNSDVTCSYPFEELRDMHLAHGGEGTIMVTKVDEPSKYGVVLTLPGKSTIDRFWMDVGQPKDYLSGMCLYLTHLSQQKSKLLTDVAATEWAQGGNVLVDPSAKIDPTAVIGPNVVIGAN